MKKVEKCWSFLELYENGYSIYASNARAVYQKPKANIPEDLLLESLQDIVILGSIKNKKITNSYEPNEELSMRLTFVYILTFNARRRGELLKWPWMIGKMVDQAFEENSDMEKFEDPVEKVIPKRWKICYTEGKKRKEGARWKS